MFDDDTDRDPGRGGPDRGWRAGADHVDPSDPLLLERLGVVVPDDARELDADRRLVVGDDRSATLRALVVLLRPVRRVPRVVATAVLVAGLAFSVVLAGSLLTFFAPRTVVLQAHSLPLATSPVADVGEVGGLLPEAVVRLDDAIDVDARTLRPGLLFMLPDAPCPTCAAVLAALWHQSREYGLRMYVVTDERGADAGVDLIATATQRSAHLVVDGAGALTAAYRADVVRVPLVHADGVVSGVIDDPRTSTRYEQLLSPLRTAGAPPSVRPAARAG